MSDATLPEIVRDLLDLDERAGKLSAAMQVMLQRRGIHGGTDFGRGGHHLDPVGPPPELHAPLTRAQMAIHDLRAVLNAGVKADWWRWCRRHRQPRLPRRSRPSSPESPPNPNPRSAASGADSPFQQKVFPHESCHDRKRANTAGCWCHSLRHG